MALNAKGLIIYPFHAVFLKHCPQLRSSKVNNGQSIVGVLPFGIVESRKHFVGGNVTLIQGLTYGSTVEAEPCVLLTSDVSGRSRYMEMRHKGNTLLLGPLNS